MAEFSERKTGRATRGWQKNGGQKQFFTPNLFAFLTVLRSQHLFTKHGITDRINVQRDGSKAKPYQIKHVRRILLANPDLR